MFEFNWAAYEPAQGKFTASYMTAMKAELKAYQAAGMKVTLGLGLQDPPAWALALNNGTYIDQAGAPAAASASAADPGVLRRRPVRRRRPTSPGHQGANAHAAVLQFWGHPASAIAAA